jgi:hypothetical protein
LSIVIYANRIEYGRGWNNFGILRVRCGKGRGWNFRILAFSYSFSYVGCGL